ncbi:MAG TPA: glycosyltransferase family 2 protein [Pirellulaceae bacterium]|nr:glycosyltransferase family 2 protein [Pirellulaceae bacterium]
MPLWNEADSLEQLHGELSSVAAEQGLELEYVFVDDGSTDRSWEVVQRLAANDSRVRAIRFRRNFGKAAALAAGFEAARGDVVFTLDADLQDDPHEIPRFLAKLDEGYDLVSGWKEVRHDPIEKVLPSRVFNGVVSWLTGVKLHDHNCGFKCYRGQVVKDVRLYGEFHRFVPVLAAARGWRVGELVVNHRKRQFGHSKYGIRRYLRGLLDMVTAVVLTTYRDRPQHLFGGLGLFLGGWGAALLALAMAMLIWFGTAKPPSLILALSFPLVMAVVATGLLVGGLISFLAGLLGEQLIARTSPSPPPYVVRERIERDETTSGESR